MKKQGMIVVLLGLSLLTACGKKEEEKTVIPPKKIVSEVLALREMEDKFQSDAILEPKDKVNHSTEKGGTVQTIHKKNGDFVHKGDLIVSFSDPLTQANYLRANADLKTAEMSYQIAAGNHQKFKQLYDRALVSHLEYVNYEKAVVSARGQLDVARAMFQSAKNDYDKLNRRADISGLVGNLFIKEGNDVKAGETVFTIVNDGAMQAYIGLPGSYVSQVKLGDSLEVSVESLGKEYEAKIVELNPIADYNTKNYMTKIELENAEREILDGMYASVNLGVGKKEVLAVPDEAIIVRNLASYVFKVENGKARRVEVQTGSQKDAYTEISSPDIQAGDHIVVKGIFGLQDGNEVEELSPEESAKILKQEKSEN